MGSSRILVVEDDPDILHLVSYNLARDGYEVEEAHSAEAARKKLNAALPDMIVLDVMLPGMSGLDFLRGLKQEEQSRSIPVIIMSARDEDADVVTGLELGAEDYVVKPFSPRVLVARIRTVLRRNRKTDDGEAEGPLHVHGIRIDTLRHEVEVDGVPVEFAATEFALLRHFMADPGRVFTRQQLINLVRGPDYPVTDRAVDVQILGLRRKLGVRGDSIETVRGVGYRLRGLLAKRKEK